MSFIQRIKFNKLIMIVQVSTSVSEDIRIEENKQNPYSKGFCPFKVNYEVKIKIYYKLI